MDPRFQINWTDPGNPYGDISAVQVWYRLESEGTWTLGGNFGTAGGARSTTLANRGYDTVHVAFVRVVNAAGYTDAPAWSIWTPPAPGTVKTITAHDGQSYAFAAAAWRNDHSVRQGMFSPTPMGLHFGLLFYGDELVHACHGYAPVSGDIFMIRNGTEGFTGPLYFTGHNYGWNPAPAAPTGQIGWTSISQFAGADASGWEPLPSSFLNAMAAGIVRGVGLFTFSDFQSNYKVFKGPYSNALAGVINLRW